MRYHAPKSASKLLAMSSSMQYQLNARTVTKTDIEEILWKSYNVYMNTNKQTNKKDNMVIHIFTQYSANPDKSEYFAE